MNLFTVRDTELTQISYLNVKHFEAFKIYNGADGLLIYSEILHYERINVIKCLPQSTIKLCFIDNLLKQ